MLICTALFAEYKCLFGISENPPGPVAGDADYGYDKDRSSLFYAGPNGAAYVFIFEKLDKIYRGDDIPHYSQDDAIKFAEKHSTYKIRSNLSLADYWKTTKNFSLVCLEEGSFKLWTWGRIALFGDSAHKMTPNIGVGGNAGIESAAALANALKAISDQSNGQQPSQELVEKELQQYQKSREARVNQIILSTGEVTRMQATKTLYHSFMAWMARVYPGGDFIANFLSEYLSGSVMLVSEYLKLECSQGADLGIELSPSA
jgi:flavin-dependent dehydrogenase